MQKNNGFKKMTTQVFMKYKSMYSTIPRCISCNGVILVGEEYTKTIGSRVKYICDFCSKKFEETGIMVYQYSKSKDE